jgi:hypothetical protein
MLSGVYFSNGKHTHDNEYYKNMFKTIMDNIRAGGVEALKKYLEKVDVFSLGLCLASAFYIRTRCVYKFDGAYMVQQNGTMTPITHRNTAIWVEGFYTVIKGMLHPNPDERYTAREALYEYQDYLSNINNLGISVISKEAFIEVDSPFESELAPFSSNPGSFNSSANSGLSGNSLGLNITLVENHNRNENNNKNKNEKNNKNRTQKNKNQYINNNPRELLSESYRTTSTPSELNKGFVQSSNNADDNQVNNASINRLLRQMGRIAIPMSGESKPRYYQVESLGSNEF